MLKMLLAAHVSRLKVKGWTCLGMGGRFPQLVQSTVKFSHIETGERLKVFIVVKHAK